MNRRLVLGFVSAGMLTLGWPVTAQTAQMSAAEITALLSGNTIVGNWSGTDYRQFFEADGRTVYMLGDGRRDDGQWRVSAETNDYESWWRSTGWTPYAMVRTDAGGYAWINGDRLEPFEVLSGRQIE
ncbi:MULTISPECIES: hypothetical protein [unclassified Roseovarius]|jgi:hypothetical protein|uniref:hypothetical protein n=1 Tax=unclassified Roseovarius TaxID=2614913 RepID=UPI0000684D5B|nr:MULTISPECIES: hypothetical protein [unclassified Roseovarius]EAQ25455.1 hypothetical protein ROS217_06845 [Roseovarius sp. 217]KJS44910.1 MAG: hypothetical protein VR71_03970 [Roseovarius sp. BRH_c41]